MHITNFYGRRSTVQRPRQAFIFRAVKPSVCTINMANVIPSCRNADIDDDLDLTDALNGRLAEILTNEKTYISLVNMVDSFVNCLSSLLGRPGCPVYGW